MTRYRQNQEIAWRDIEGEAVLIDPADGVVFVLNQVGCRVWSELEEPSSSREIARRIAAEYHEDEERVRKDVLPFLEALSRSQLVERVS